MLAALLLSAVLGFSLVAARPDSLVHEGLTRHIRHDGWSMKGYQSRNMLLARSQAEISTPARRLLQLGSSSSPLLATAPQSPQSQPQPLLDAAEEGDLDAVKREVDGGTDVDTRAPENDATPLILASAYGHTDVMLFLLEEGADIDAADNNGNTPLFVAAQNGHDDIVTALINAGADTEAAKNSGETALIAAAHDGHYVIVKELISGGADVNAKEEDDITALHYAARLSGGSRILTALLDAGANVDAQTNVGNTPLHFATHFGQKRNIEILLDAGADTTLRTEASAGLGSSAEDVICGCMDGLEDADAEIKALCHVNACSDLDDMLALFD